MKPAVLDHVLGHPHTGERLRSRLHGYARTIAPGWDYPLLIRDSGATTDGMLIFGLLMEDLRLLDTYEDVEDGAYERIPVMVETWGRGTCSTELAAETYVAGPRFPSVAPIPQNQ